MAQPDIMQNQLTLPASVVEKLTISPVEKSELG